MDRHRPRRSAWSRPWLMLCAGASLAACQVLPEQLLSDPRSEPAEPGWRVVERTGEARYLAPSMASWEQIAAASLIPAGSQVTTGIGGRLIVDHDADQLSAGTNSRFILPGWEAGDSVRQTAGWLRYRIASDRPATFGIETPFLDLLIDDAVVDVTVGDSETEVAVVSGRVRVKTLDGRRQIDLHAGYIGYASVEDDALAVRRGSGAPLERVPPTVLPALHPDRGARGAAPVAPAPRVAATGPAPGISGTDAPGVAAVARPAMASSAPASAGAPGAAASDPPAEAVLVEAAFVTPPGSSAADAAQAEIRRRFERLTAGLLDGLPPAWPAASQPGRR